mmetsp:Transcript_28379/g.65789  ORF Transcript_28379/g.65789 Transcript_28379/m.65789 type:complete len:165 (-) Transcript_28379:122-616(-)
MVLKIVRSFVDIIVAEGEALHRLPVLLVALPTVLAIIVSTWPDTLQPYAVRLWRSLQWRCCPSRRWMQKEGSYFIVFDKSESKDMGLMVESVEHSGRLLVKAITGGLAEQWNAAHPESAVREGDCILEVNSVGGDVAEMLAKCKHDQVLVLRLVRDSISRSKIE